MPSHNNNNIGALGNLTEETFGNLKGGFKTTNPAFNLGPISISKGTAANTALGFTPIGFPVQIFSGIQSYQAEKAAQQALGQNKGFVNTITDMVTNPALDTARNIADVNKDGIVSDREAQNFGMNRGLTAYQVGRDPTAGYKAGTVNVSPLGKMDPKGGIIGSYQNRSVNPNIYSQTKVDSLTSGIGKGVGVSGDLGGVGKVGYTGSKGSFLGFGRAEGVDPSQSQQTGEQTSIKNTQDLSKSFADDAATTDSETTYICTALYDMGDMKQYIYEYDQRYGKLVHPAVYRGYELWGKFLAKQIRKKGLTYKIVKPIALAWAYQMAYDLSKGKKGKNSKPVKILKTIGEGVCYVLGQIFKRRFKWQKST
jgi:hypothetical protein